MNVGSSKPVIKYRNSDFKVTEVSLIPDGTSSDTRSKEHSVLHLLKEGYTTFEAINRLAEFLGIDRQSIHCQGLKDEDGVTEQIISVNLLLKTNQLDKFNHLNSNLAKGWMRLKLKGYSGSAVVEKQLHGNLFNLTIRNMNEGDVDNLIKYCEDNSDFICLNYYDNQRFGLPGGPFIAHLIGESIINKDWQKADKLYRISGNAELDYEDSMLKTNENLVKKIDIRKLNFFVSAYNSYLWNKKLSNQLTGSQEINIFDGLDVRLLSHEQTKLKPLISCDAYKVNTGKTVSRLNKSRSSIISTTIFTNNKREDSFFKGKWSLDLQFFLPAGSYATICIKQLLANLQL